MITQLLIYLLIAAAIVWVVYTIIKDGAGKGVVVAGGFILGYFVIAVIVFWVLTNVILGRSRL